MLPRLGRATVGALSGWKETAAACRCRRLSRRRARGRLDWLIMEHARSRRGFTLVEVAVALSILIVALLTGIALVLQQPRVVRRIDAERQAQQVMEWTLEEMRGGLIPLRSTGDVGWPLGSFVEGSPAPDLKIAVIVTPTTPAGLYQVSVAARYTTFGKLQRRRLQTMIWRPAGAAP